MYSCLHTLPKSDSHVTFCAVVIFCTVSERVTKLLFPTHCLFLLKLDILFLYKRLYEQGKVQKITKAHISIYERSYERKIDLTNKA